MKIAVYSHYFVPEIGAPSARIYDLAREWIKQGDDVQVVTCFPNHPTGVLYPGYSKQFYQHESIDGIDVHRTWTYITPNKGLAKKTIGHVSFYPSSLIASARALATPDVIVGTSPTFFAAMAAQRVASRRGVPFVMEVRDLWPAVFVELGVLRNRVLIHALERLELSLYRKAARVVTVTEAFRQNLIERGVPDWKVTTIPNGADVNFWKPQSDDASLRTRLGLDGRTVVLYIGAHGISQALNSILSAAQKLADDSRIVFLFVGEGAEKEMLINRTRRDRIDNVRFMDSVGKDEVRNFYAVADLCLVPLRDIPLFDGFIPSKMFEMMAMKKPIVGSVRGEAAGILQRSGGAVVVSPENADEIAAAVRRLANDSVTRAKLGEAAREFVITNYGRHALAASYRTLLAASIADYRERPE